MTPPLFDRIDTDAERQAAQERLVHLAFTERRPSDDIERKSVQDALADYELRARGVRR